MDSMRIIACVRWNVAGIAREKTPAARLRRKLLSATFSILMLLSADTFAQEVREIRGTVRDGRGQLLVGAIVQLRSDATLQIRSYITQSDGRYHFGQLSTDVTYKVKAIYKGTCGHSRAVSKFSSHARAT